MFKLFVNIKVLSILFNLTVIYCDGEINIRKNYAPQIRRIQRQTILEYLNTTVNPCDNFWEYSCGNQLSDSRTSFQELETIMEDIPLMINVSLSDMEFFRSFQNDHPVVKVKEYYDSCMDMKRVSQRGLNPLLKFLRSNFQIPELEDNIENKEGSNRKNLYDWVKIISKLRLFGDNTLIKSMVDKNFLNADAYALYLDQPGKDVNSLIYDSFSIYDVLKEFQLSDDLMTNITLEVTEFEYELQNLLEYEKDRPFIRSELYDSVNVGQLSELYPNLNLLRYITLIRKKSFEIDDKIFINSKYLNDLDNLISRTPARTITLYAIMKFSLYTAVQYLRANYDEAADEYEDENWWQACVSAVAENMDMAVSNIFVKKFLRSKKRSNIDNVIMDIKRQFGKVIKQINWIDKKTKSKFIEKFESMHVEIGFPGFILKRSALKRWYKGIKINKNKFFESSMNLLKLNEKRSLRMIGETSKTIDELYEMKHTSENAEYDIGTNKISIASGILQLPYFHPGYPGYMKYGVIGFIISHEFIHAFDNLGRKFDFKGNLANWWTEESSREYNKRAICLINQYNDYGIDGSFTLSENISDNIGLEIAYLAYLDWLERNKNDTRLMRRETIKGVKLNRDQLFFIASTQWRCGLLNQNQNINDPHPDERIRVSVTLSNSEDFSRNFKCKKGDHLNPHEKCKFLQ